MKALLVVLSLVLVAWYVPSLSNDEASQAPLAPAALLADGTCGDLNGDGAVNMADALASMQIVVGTIKPSLTQRRLGDLNRNGAVNVEDSLILLRRVTGATQNTLKCGLVLKVADARGAVGQTLPMRVFLHHATDGVSGFILKVRVEDPAVARIQSVKLPGYAPPIFPPVVELTNTDVESSVRIVVVDLNGVLEGEFIRKVVATLDVKLESAGGTQLLAEVIKLDDDNPGADLAPATLVVPGSVSTSASSAQ